MYLSTFLKNEYLTSTCTWYTFGVLGVLEYLVNSTVLDPNPGNDLVLYKNWIDLMSDIYNTSITHVQLHDP